jgi:hypothetical protein
MWVRSRNHFDYGFQQFGMKTKIGLVSNVGSLKHLISTKLTRPQGRIGLWLSYVLVVWDHMHQLLSKTCSTPTNVTRINSVKSFIRIQKTTMPRISTLQTCNLQLIICQGDKQTGPAQMIWTWLKSSHKNIKCSTEDSKFLSSYIIVCTSSSCQDQTDLFIIPVKETKNIMTTWRSYLPIIVTVMKLRACLVPRQKLPQRCASRHSSRRAFRPPRKTLFRGGGARGVAGVGWQPNIPLVISKPAGQIELDPSTVDELFWDDSSCLGQVHCNNKLA